MRNILSAPTLCFSRIFSIRKALLALAFLLPLGGAAQVPDDFFDQLVDDGPGVDYALGLTFDDNGRMYTWHRLGLVKIWDDNHDGAILIDIFPEMAFYGDHGLLGFALDPNFLSNGYMYLYYIVDQHHLLEFGSPNYNPNQTNVDKATIGRVTRYQADINTGFTSLVANSRTVLIGDGISNGPPVLHISHSGGMLAFGDDGSLLICMGDGSDYDQIDYGSAAGGNNFAQEGLNLGILRVQEDVGTFRSQMVNSYSGKVLRINPVTGEGYPSNPYYDANNPNSAQSRVWALGMRQPFRMTHVPGTGSTDPADGNPGHFYIGDVGGNQWEEVNFINEPGLNMGWPLFEGHVSLPRFDTLPIFNLDAPNPLAGVNGCPDYFYFSDLTQKATHEAVVFKNPCDTSQLIPDNIPTFIHHLPAVAYRNKTNPEVLTFVPGVDAEGNPVGVSITDTSAVSGQPFTGAAALGGMFYTGEAYPPAYKNSYFHADFFGQVHNMKVDEQGYINAVEVFRNDSFPVLTMAMNPIDENIYYVGYNPYQIRKFQFGGNVPPVAVIASSTAAGPENYGPSPLTVDFNATGSYEPQEEPITFLWDFGNGNTSTDSIPSMTFTAEANTPTSYTVTLTVTDSLGASDTEEMIISVNNTPPVVDITSIEDGDFYTFPEDIELNMEGVVTDAEHSQEELSYAWQLHLHHNSHYHSEPVDTNRITHASFLPFGCQEDTYWYRIGLSVTDPSGLIGYDEVEIFPWCQGEIFDLLDLSQGDSESGIKLEWIVGDEVDVVNYELQRSGPDMIFTKIADVSGSGTGPGAFNYEHVDTDPLMGESWYRVKVRNGDGAFDFSPAIQVAFFGRNDLVVYPNPTDDILYLGVDEVNGSLKMELFDMRGKLVKSQSWESTSSLLAEIDLTDLRPGIYFYRVSNGSYLYRGKVMKD